jgi:RNA polymerase sigma factor (sigma-70 family)
MTTMTPNEIDLEGTIRQLGAISPEVLQTVRERVHRNLHSEQLAAFSMDTSTASLPVPWPILLAGVTVLIERHGQFVYRTAYALTGSETDAENILQAIFVRLLAREVPADLNGGLELYLYQAAFNLSLKAVHDRNRQVLGDDIEIGGEVFDRRLQKAIARLNPAAAQILILRYVHDYSLAAIAAMLGSTSGAVAESLFCSHARLRPWLASNGECSRDQV